MEGILLISEEPDYVARSIDSSMAKFSNQDVIAFDWTSNNL